VHPVHITKPAVAAVDHNPAASRDHASRLAPPHPIEQRAPEKIRPERLGYLVHKHIGPAPQIIGNSVRN
jgi:hypothetical protein